MQSIVSAWTVAHKYRIAGNFQEGKIFVIEQYVVISWIIFSWLLLALQVKVASFVGQNIRGQTSNHEYCATRKLPSIRPWKNNYALFSAYLCF